MKKLVLSLLLVLIVSVGVAFAGSDRFEAQEKILESQLDMNQNVLTDGKVKIENIEYDVDIYENNVLVQLEMNVISGDGNWSKFDKPAFDKLMQNTVAKIRKNLNNQTIPVNVSVELDKKIGEDITVYNKTF